MLTRPAHCDMCIDGPEAIGGSTAISTGRRQLAECARTHWRVTVFDRNCRTRREVR
jgi:hypothetical protein